MCVCVCERERERERQRDREREKVRELPVVVRKINNELDIRAPVDRGG